MTLASLKTWLSGAWRSRTLVISLALMVLGELDAELHVLQSNLPAAIYGRLVLWCGLVMFAMRTITSVSIAAKAAAGTAPPAPPA
jgi:hypothetical protein